MQRIESPAPGRFSVVEAASGGTASFGCANVGDYSFERTDAGTLHVQEIADVCDSRGWRSSSRESWTGLPPESTGGLPTEESSPSASTSQEPAPTVTFSEVETPSPEEPTPSEQPNAT